MAAAQLCPGAQDQVVEWGVLIDLDDPGEQSGEPLVAHPDAKGFVEPEALGGNVVETQGAAEQEDGKQQASDERVVWRFAGRWCRGYLLGSCSGSRKRAIESISGVFTKVTHKQAPKKLNSNLDRINRICRINRRLSFCLIEENRRFSGFTSSKVQIWDVQLRV